MTWRSPTPHCCALQVPRFVNRLRLSRGHVPVRHALEWPVAGRSDPALRAAARTRLCKVAMDQTVIRTFELHPRAAAPRGEARGGRVRQIGRRALVLAAAVAVPALAAPEEWRNLDLGAAGTAQVTLQPMPFEQAGESFPGSAFYYLAPD